MLSQNVRGASAPTTGGAGGVNPLQIGLGVGVSGVQQMLTQGSGQATGQWSDLRLDGDGFFMVASTRPTTTPTDVAFTRAGNFTLDKNGDLVTASGQYVLGDPAAAGLASDLRRREPRPDQHPERRPGRVRRQRRRRQLRRLHRRAAGRRPDRDRQVPEPGRPQPDRRQPLPVVAELGHLRLDEPEQHVAADHRRRLVGRSGPERPRRGIAARSRCRTSTSPRSSPR